MAEASSSTKSVLNRFNIVGKNIVITGGNRGLGLSFAQSLAEVGANIAAIDLGDGPSEAFAHLAATGKHRYYQANTSDYDGLMKTIDQVHRDFGSIDGW
jgi:NAD(P)-dependent dehydrogenase (short-subunit alcohol dehydrogenase family)